MIATLSNLEIASTDFDTYIDMRQLHINPALLEQRGFEGSVLLRGTTQQAAGEERLALFNLWDSATSSNSFVKSSITFAIVLNGGA